MCRLYATYDGSTRAASETGGLWARPTSPPTEREGPCQGGGEYFGFTVVQWLLLCVVVAFFGPALELLVRELAPFLANSPRTRGVPTEDTQCEEG